MRGFLLSALPRHCPRPSALAVAALGLVLLLGAILRADFAAHAPAFLVGNDSADYFQAGVGLARGEGLRLPLKRAPLYPVFVAGVVVVFGPSLEAVAAVQHALGLASVVLVYLLGALAFGRPVGLAAALGTALNGSLLQMERIVATEALFTPLLLAALLLFLLARRADRRSLYLLAGLTFGLCALIRPAGPALLPVALAVAFFRRGPLRPRLAASGLLCLGFLLAVGPWTLRQALTPDRPPALGGLGDSLYSRVRRYDPGFDFRDLAPPDADPERARQRTRVFELAQLYQYPREVRRDLQAEFPISDAQADALLREVALQVIRQEPWRYLRGTVTRSLELLRGRDVPVVDLWASRFNSRSTQAWPEPLRFALGQPEAQWPATNLARLQDLADLYRDDQGLGRWLVALFPLGAILCFVSRRGPGVAVLPLVVLSQLLLHVALDGPLFRYRYPLQPLITLLCAAGGALLLAQARALLGLDRRGSVQEPCNLSGPDVMGRL